MSFTFKIKKMYIKIIVQLEITITKMYKINMEE